MEERLQKASFGLFFWLLGVAVCFSRAPLEARAYNEPEFDNWLAISMETVGHLFILVSIAEVLALAGRVWLTAIEEICFLLSQLVRKPPSGLPMGQPYS